MAYSYSETSVGSDWSESVPDVETSELSFFHDSEDTGAKIVIGCQVLDPLSVMRGLSAIQSQYDCYICGLSIVLLWGLRKFLQEIKMCSPVYR